MAPKKDFPQTEPEWVPPETDEGSEEATQQLKEIIKDNERMAEKQRVGHGQQTNMDSTVVKKRYQEVRKMMEEE
tara:strand:+ start:535 stop:756 length:222 start_codon:yes stop_codon:yes gene_type:complete